MKGILYGIGVGPGDPELITLKAVRLIKETGYIAIPARDKESCTSYQIARQVVPALEDKNILCLPMPMTKDECLLRESHQKAAKMVEEVLNRGENLCFLTLGDPCIYSTYFYVARLVCAHGFSCEIISGIPSFCAAAAALHKNLGEQGEPITILPGSYDITSFLENPGTKIMMKSGKQLSFVKAALKEHGLTASMVENCGMENEKQYASLEDIPEQAGYYSLIIAK
ncbi:MAG: precorrin-2 C(20)-methyltransferase [Roseburia sp.]|nr:precorrin-2 C(20)-methyltransferase [Roseburia sp.]MCM1278203.1 precorrin-2 C(20)-methyltransferase [Robinsoniella sp.]